MNDPPFHMLPNHIYNGLQHSAFEYSHPSNSQTYYGQMPVLLAVRIMDGLFIGNAVSSQDDEFLFSNKVTYIVNCAGIEVPNVFTAKGIEYLTFAWRNLPSTLILDPQERNISKISRVIDKAFMKGESVLIHDVDGKSRCCVVIASYLIYKYGWTLESVLKCLDLVHPEMDIPVFFMKQLKAYAKKKQLTIDIFECNIDELQVPLKNEQILLKNTYLNIIPPKIEDIAVEERKIFTKKKKVGFSENKGYAPDVLEKQNLRPIFMDGQPNGILKKRRQCNGYMYHESKTSFDSSQNYNDVIKTSPQSEEPSPLFQKREDLYLTTPSMESKLSQLTFDIHGEEKKKRKKKSLQIINPKSIQPLQITNSNFFTSSLNINSMTPQPPKVPPTNKSRRNVKYKSFFEEEDGNREIIYSGKDDLLKKTKRIRPKSAPSQLTQRKSIVPPKKKIIRPTSAPPKKSNALTSIYSKHQTVTNPTSTTIKPKKKKRKKKKVVDSSRLMRPTLSFLRKTVKKSV